MSEVGVTIITVVPATQNSINHCKFAEDLQLRTDESAERMVVVVLIMILKTFNANPVINCHTYCKTTTETPVHFYHKMFKDALITYGMHLSTELKTQYVYNL